MFVLMLCISFVFSAPSPDLASLQSPQGWKHNKKINDKKVGVIHVYQKSIATFPCFRGTGVSKTSLEIFEKIARDIPSAMQWSSSGLKESVVITQTAAHVDYYQYLDISFFSDRHWFLRGTFQKSAESFSMSWQKIPEDAHRAFVERKSNKYPKAIEPPVNLGAWRFSQVENGDTLVEYLICTHPGGSVPKQFRSVGTLKTLPTNVKDMILEARRRDK